MTQPLKPSTFVDWIIQVQPHRGTDWKTIARFKSQKDAIEWCYLWRETGIGRVPANLENFRVIKVKKNSHKPL